MATLSGLFYLGGDAELRFMPDGTPVANMRVAYNYGPKDAEGKRPTQWLDAALIGKRAQSLAPHLLKGTKIVATLEDPHIDEYKRRDDGGAGYKLAGRILTLEFAGDKRPNDSAGKTQAAKPRGFDAMDGEIPY